MWKALLSAGKAYLAVKVVEMIASAFTAKKGSAQRSKQPARTIAQSARAASSKSRSAPANSQAKTRGRKAA